MTLSSAACLAFFLLLLARPGGAAASELRRDLSGITEIDIAGDAALVTLTAADGPPEARLTARRSGWFSRWYSSWFYNDCRTDSRMWVEGRVLHVTVVAPSAFEASDCTVELTARLPEGTAVRIGLDAVEARLDGRFGALDLGTRAGNVMLTGTVEAAELSGMALRARLDLAGRPAGWPAPRALRFSAGSLDAAVELGAGDHAGWRVDAKAALVDTGLANDPAAPTQLAVSGDYVRLRLR
ncbi:hypothetical protein J2X65_001481 [Ancylobacter sp. 3268]|uniref:hypothetical protein n=1 Tax=Ancylobacter sp. 3268 TaxID=2817752 RepID=UPI00285E3BF8|nr:hypothetical protein [Ancylobacter sp. 3268]MDR6952130.1 hypothetical protein [Ancylobacter sp. 3268]